MKQLVRSVFATFGLEIRRAGKHLSKLNSTHEAGPHAGKILEFIGPSGVGKSYLRNYLIRKISGDWVDGSKLDWREVDANYRRHIPLELNKAYAQLCVRFAQEAFEKDFRYQTSEQIMRFASFQLGNIRKHLLLEAGLPVGVIMDEGLVFINQKGLGELLADSERMISSILGRRYLIALSSPPDLVLTQIRKRHREQPHLPEYQGFSDEGIVDSIKQQQDQIEKFLTRAEPYLGGLLRIRSDLPIEQNEEAVLNFMDSFTPSHSKVSG